MQQKSFGKLVWELLSPFIIFIALSLVVELAAIALAVPLQEFAVEVAGVRAVIIGLVFALLYNRDKVNTEKLAIEKYVYILVLGIAGCLFLNNLLMASGLMNESAGYQDVTVMMYESPLGVRLLCVGVLVPVMEELLFRGMIYRSLRKYSKFAVATLISAILFGVSHGNIVQGLYGGVMGLLLAYVYEAYGSLWAPIVLHVTLNVTSLVATENGFFDWMFEDATRLLVCTTALFILDIVVLFIISKINVTKMLNKLVKE